MRQFSSFRDPDGRVVFDGESVWRAVDSSADTKLRDLLDLDIIKSWQQEGKLIRADAGSKEEFVSFLGAGANANPSDSDVHYRHPRIDFPSYPFEWAPEMLHAAGELTLDIAEGLLQKNWGLKDATPYNILFQGSKPIFIDVLSFEPRDTANPIWLPYSQFVRTFLLPLLVSRKINVPLKAIFQSNRDGLDISEAANYFGKTAKFGSPVFSLVTLPNFLVNRAEKKTDLYKEPRMASAEQARFVLASTLRRLRRQLQKVEPRSNRDSKWTEYTGHNQKSIPEYMNAKQGFVERIVNSRRPKRVLDVGCNTGFFSFFAARCGAAVVALDHDPAVVGEVWRNAKNEKLDVLPLVVDLSRPSPAMGWRNSETPSFLDRAVGKFDLVMMLAVLHHFLVHERVPLRDVMALAADLTTDALIIEFVPPSDPMFRHIARGREHLHEGLSVQVFETAANEFFNIIESKPLPQTDRYLYLMTKK